MVELEVVKLGIDLRSLVVHIYWNMKISNLDLYWLAGYLEGEGSFIKGPPSSPGSPGITASTTDEDIAKRAADLLGVSYCACKKKKAHWKQPFRFSKKGHEAVEIMKLLHPLMGVRRKKQIDLACASLNLSYRKLSKSDISEICIRCKDGRFTQRQIAKDFSVSREAVNKIYSKYKKLMVGKGEVDSQMIVNHQVADASSVSHPI